jgi:hypothetical protein
MQTWTFFFNQTFKEYSPALFASDNNYLNHHNQSAIISSVKKQKFNRCLQSRNSRFPVEIFFSKRRNPHF